MKIIEQLLQLQEMELGPRAASPAVRREIGVLRQEVPATILGHYDRLVSRGKKAVAVVRRGVCTGCQMRLPSGIHAKLLRDDDICVCDNCARYLLLAAEEEIPAAQPAPPAPKRAARRRAAAPALEPVAA
jgi:predicted  nucleic acid-binding Zn-ribbon protein